MLEDLKDYNERQDLQCYIYEGHKDAYGVKGRHYDFSSMSLEDLRKEADRIEIAIDEAVAAEKTQEEESIKKFQARIADIMACGAGNRKNALRWMTQTETFYSSQDVEHYVYKQGILFTDFGTELLKELMDIVTFKEIA